jgi:hypothetical protein
VVASVLFFKLTVSRRNFYWQIQLQSFHTAWALNVGFQRLTTSVAIGEERTWLDLQLAPPSRD